MRLFEQEKNAVDETTFCFDDDPAGIIHYIGCISEHEKPYWAGYCDIENGCDFYTAEALFTARIYDQRSIQERWEHVIFHEIGGVPVEHYDK